MELYNMNTKLFGDLRILLNNGSDGTEQLCISGFASIVACSRLPESDGPGFVSEDECPMSPPGL